ncbi:MAG TPA: hypothetical protein VFZ16_14705 [Hyphomicrobiaceae bacterium]|nr:hypothetical protein [Hyphomicrobiaceae bacterium]
MGAIHVGGFSLRFKARRGAAALVLLGLASLAPPVEAGPSPEEYIARSGGTATFVPYGELEIDGRKIICGRRPTVLDEKLDDYGAAYPGFLILNPKLLAKVAPAVKLWVHAHECAHQYRGPDEETADCFAVQRGRRQGWLTPEGLDEVCNFIAPAKGDGMHFAGSHRCEAMRRCYADPIPR